MKTYFSIASNTIFQILSRAATAIVGLVVTRLITSGFGLEGYGQYQIILAFVTLWWILTDFGLNAVVVREMAAHEEKLQPFFESLLSLRTLLGVGLMLLALIITLFLPYSPLIKFGILIASITILAQGMMGSAHGIFQVKLAYDRQFYANLAGSLLFLGLVVFIVQKNLGIVALVTAFSLGYLMMMVLSLVFSRRWVSINFGRDTAELKRIFKITVPFGLALLLSLGAFKIDAVLMSVLKIADWTNEAAVGIYQLAYKVFELVLVVPVFFMNVMYPILVRHFEESFENFKATFFKTLGFLFLAAILISASIFILAPLIVRILAKGESFSPSIEVLRIFAWQPPIFYLTAPLMWVVMVFKKQTKLIGVYAVAFLFNLVANFWLIPKYAFWAAAWITGATELLILILLGIIVIYHWRQFQGATLTKAPPS